MRELALALLNDDQGINSAAWKILLDLLLESPEENTDILRAVSSQDDRWFLPESFFDETRS